MADLTQITIVANDTTYTIRRPPEFQPKREDVYGAEYTTCTGKYIADRIGWKYSDMTLSWDALPQSEVEALIAMTGECTITFDDPSSDEITESVIRSSIVYLRHRYTRYNIVTKTNEVWWEDVSCDIKFLNTHTE
jgi:hypothetical protein